MLLDEGTLRELTSRLEHVLAGCGSLPVAREDLISEVVLRLLATEGSREIRNPFAYARTILRNLIRDHLRRAQRTQKVLETVAHAAPVDDPGSGDADRFDAGELLTYLLERTELSPLQATVVRKVYLEDMTLSEVAREMDKNPGTILRHLRRGLEKLENRATELELQR